MPRKTKLSECEIQVGDVVKPNGLNLPPLMVVTKVSLIPKEFLAAHRGIPHLQRDPYWIWVEGMHGHEVDKNVFAGNEGKEEDECHEAIWVGYLKLDTFLTPAKRAIDEATKD